MDIRDIAPGLTRDPAGYWSTREETATSYPAGGNEFCLSVESSSFWFAHRNRVIEAAVRRYPPADGPIFDVGAGNGFVTAALQQAGFPAVAIEPNRAGTLNAVARGVTDVVCGTLPSEAFRRNTAGAIGLFDVIEHVEDDRALLNSLRPYLKTGGRLYITTPAYQWLWSGNDVRSGHYRRYTTSRLAELAAECRYRVDYVTYFFWFLPPAVYLFRTLRSDRFATGCEMPGHDVTARTRSQHSAGGSVLRRLAERGLAFEARRAARGASIPFGGSCLMVASVLD